MNMPRCTFSRFLGSLFVFGLMVHGGMAAAAGKGGKGQDTLTKVVEINKQALSQMQAGHYDAARDALWGAIVVLNDANLSEHDLSARTHVHLAAVYMTGFNDRAKAIRQFVMALKINSNIKITPQVETAALDEAFDAARVQAGLAPAARTSAPPSAAEKTSTTASPAAAIEEPSTGMVAAGGASTGAGGRRGLRSARRAPDVEEPPPPAKVSQALLCPLPDEVPPKEDIILRCITQKKPRQATATLSYRESGSEEFTSLPMTRSPRGWLSATVPASVVKGSAFQFYVMAKIPGAKEPITMGSPDAPSLIPLVDGAAPMNNAALVALLRGEATTTTAAMPVADDKAPLEDINKQFKIDEDLRKYHRRLAGSFLFSLGGGMGMTYHGKAKADGHFTRTQGDQVIDLPPLSVNGGTNPASLFQLVPEIGYVFSDQLAMSIQVRFQYAPFDSTGMVSGTQPPGFALAFFLRAQYNFLTLGNSQIFASVAAGGGQRAFLSYIPRACDSSGVALDKDLPAGCTRYITDHSNVVSAGPVAAAVGVGYLYHLTRWMGIWLEVRGMSSVAPIMLLGEGNLGLVFAYKAEKGTPPPAKEEGGWERPPEEDKPLIDAPPSD